MVKKIFLIRHGQTDYNLQGIVQGSGVDTSLNARGLRQSGFFYERYSATKFDKVYTSALKRSIESVKQFIDAGVPHEAWPELNEIHWGKKEKIKISDADNLYYNDMISDWQNGRTDRRIEGGESPDEVQARIRKFLSVMNSRKDEKTVLICMHGRAIRILLCTLFNYELKYMDMFHHQNLCLYKIGFTGSMFSLDSYNDLSHLREE
jgi:broad specificity phosphatase PhoE